MVLEKIEIPFAFTGNLHEQSQSAGMVVGDMVLGTILRCLREEEENDRGRPSSE